MNFLTGTSDRMLLMHATVLTSWKSTSDFPEALRVTAKAKADFLSQQHDLYIRGKRLILESVEAGVTVMRAHVEIDETVENVCLDIGLRLKKECEALCDVQIAGDDLSVCRSTASEISQYLHRILCLRRELLNLGATGIS